MDLNPTVLPPLKSWNPYKSRHSPMPKGLEKPLENPPKPPCKKKERKPVNLSRPDFEGRRTTALSYLVVTSDPFVGVWGGRRAF